jgi:prephenate dehydrogenase
MCCIVVAFSFNKLVILGVGLIGGSLARALRERGHDGTIVGVGRSARSVQRALELGVIDQAVVFDDPAGLADALCDADIVLLAAPVAQTRALLDAIAPHLDARAIVTDAGSTKSDVIAAARDALGTRLAQFVPGHPIAGREASGVEAALADLYDGRNVVLCPLPENSRASIDRIGAMWRATGASLHEMSAQQHDAVFAAVSHLPHVLSFALIETILQASDAALKFSFAAGGFRDFTRIAASSPEMWRDICMANRDALLAELDAYMVVLGAMRAAVDAGDGDALQAWFARARDARAKWGRERASGAPAASDPTGSHDIPPNTTKGVAASQPKRP